RIAGDDAGQRRSARPGTDQVVAAGRRVGNVAVAAGVPGDDRVVELDAVGEADARAAVAGDGEVLQGVAGIGAVDVHADPGVVRDRDVRRVDPALDVEAGRSVTGDRRAADLKAGALDAERGVVAHDVIAQRDRIALESVEAIVAAAADRHAANRHRRRAG